MATQNRGMVYALLTAILVLALGMAAILWVAYNRHERMLDETRDLRRTLQLKHQQIEELKARLQKCDTVRSVPDTSWDTPSTSSTEVAKRDSRAR